MILISKEPEDKAYNEFLVPGLECCHCNKWMVSEKLVDAARDIHPWQEGAMMEQLHRKNINIMAEALKNGERLCVPCLVDKAAGVRCYACQKELPGSFFVRIFGNFEIGLCCTCYETMPAKQWNEKVEWLARLHVKVD